MRRILLFALALMLSASCLSACRGKDDENDQEQNGPEDTTQNETIPPDTPIFDSDNERQGEDSKRY